MRKIVFLQVSILLVSVIFASCTLFSSGLGEKSGFTRYLSETEESIRSEKWDEAQTGCDNAFKSWHGIKPVMQIDIDHDYVNLIEDYLVSLKAYIETRDKSEALAMVMLLKHTYENIDVY